MTVARSGLTGFSLLVALATVACTSSSSGGSNGGGSTGTNVMGTVAGISFPTVSALAQVSDEAFSGGDAGNDVAHLNIKMLSGASECPFHDKAGAPNLSLSINVIANGAHAVPPGTYGLTVGVMDTRPNPAVSAGLNELDAECHASTAVCCHSPTSGTITIATVTSDAVSGSFDLAFAGGEKLSGQFHALICAGLQGTCQ